MKQSFSIEYTEKEFLSITGIGQSIFSGIFELGEKVLENEESRRARHHNSDKQEAKQQMKEARQVYALLEETLEELQDQVEQLERRVNLKEEKGDFGIPPFRTT